MLDDIALEFRRCRNRYRSRVGTLAWRAGCLAAACFATAVVGCRQGPDLPPLAPTSGTVTLDGEPLTTGTVQFVPDESKDTSGPIGTGKIGPDGEYEISTAGTPGALVGHHKVAVEAQQSSDLSDHSWSPSLVPQKYTNFHTSGLTAEVKAGEDNVVDLELTSDEQ